MINSKSGDDDGDDDDERKKKSLFKWEKESNYCLLVQLLSITECEYVFYC